MNCVQTWFRVVPEKKTSDLRRPGRPKPYLKPPLSELTFFGVIHTWGWVNTYKNTIFRGMKIHLPAILMFTRGTRFWHTTTCPSSFTRVFFGFYSQAWGIEVHFLCKLVQQKCTQTRLQRDTERLILSYSSKRSENWLSHHLTCVRVMSIFTQISGTCIAKLSSNFYVQVPEKQVRTSLMKY